MGKRPPGLALKPAAIQSLGDDPELNYETLGKVFGLDLTALPLPESNQGLLVMAHDGPRVRAADEKATLHAIVC